MDYLTFQLDVVIIVTSVCGMRTLFVAIKIAFDGNSGVECLRRIRKNKNPICIWNISNGRIR